MARRRKKKKLTLLAKVLFLSVICISGILVYKKYEDYKEEQVRLEVIRLEKLENEKKKKYEKCLTKEYTDKENNEIISNLFADINNIVKKYNVYVYYEDITSGLNFKYRENEVLYGASLIKLVDALYLLDNNVNLSDTMTYTSNYIKGSSKGMATRKIGEEVSLLDLMNYSLSVSDNSAHVMLVDYIGYNNLRDYGRSLGATAILSNVGGEKYGNQTASDTNIYLKRAYQIINNHNNGDYLKNYMTNDYQNYLIINNDIKVAHKYGSYDNYFHNIGIVFDEYPYTISILTQHGNGNYKEIIPEIHQKIYELHNTFYNNREKSCYKEVYE